MEFREHRLENGLQIVAECNPDAHTVALGFFVNAGSRDESDEISGVSHFLEHMAFKGTATRSAADVNRELDEIGSQANAYTSEEQTVYYATVLPEYKERAVEILSDMMRPALRREDMDLERQVILEEIAKYEDQPPFGAPEKCMAVHFQLHPLGRNVLGAAETVGHLSDEQMRAYFDERYSPSNMALVACGRVDFEQLVTLAESFCGHWQPREVSRLKPPAPRKTAQRVFQKESAVQQYVVHLASGPSAEDDRRFAARLLATIIGDDSGSRLFWELVDTGRAEFASMAAYEFQGAGIYMTFLCCPPELTEDNLRRVGRVLEDIHQQGIKEDELVRAKSKIVSQIVRQSERPSNRLFVVGSTWLQLRQYRTVRELVERYQSVTKDDVCQLLESYPLFPYSTVTVGPLAELPEPVSS